jgi:hypothetical protein
MELAWSALQIALLSVATGQFTSEQACPLKDLALATAAQGYPRIPQPFLSVCPLYASRACCSAAEDDAILDAVPPVIAYEPTESELAAMTNEERVANVAATLCKATLTDALCGIRCNPHQGMYTDTLQSSPPEKVRLCTSFCDNLLAACNDVPTTRGQLHGQLYSTGTEMCEGEMYLGIPMTVEVVDVDCFAPCLDNCKGHGLCRDGTCVCDEGYEGANCGDLSCPVGIAQGNATASECSSQGACDFSRGRCECFTGFAESETGIHNCEGLACPGLMQIGEYTELTPEDLGLDPVAGDGDVAFHHCSSNGVCNFTTAVCTCPFFWVGPGCEEMRCPNNCTAHGVCNQNRTCSCEAGYTLRDCSGLACPHNEWPGPSDYVPFDAGAEYPAAFLLSLAERNAKHLNASAAALALLGAKEAEVAVIAESIANEVDLSIKRHLEGQRDGLVAERAVLEDAYEKRLREEVFVVGNNSLPRPACSFHGVCDYSTGGCGCDNDTFVREPTPLRTAHDAYIGDDCSLRQCPDCATVAPNSLCNSTTGACDCNLGFEGPTCDLNSCPGSGKLYDNTNPCNKRGTCDYTSGVCTCFTGFTGVECEHTQCVASADGVGTFMTPSALAVRAFY